MNRYFKRPLSERIKRFQRAAVPVLKKAGVIKSAVFGSFARGKATKKSDIDLLVSFKGQKSLFDLAELKSNLQSELKIKIDLLTYNSVHPLLKKIIENEQIRIL